jgi:hypothetical protein
MLNRLNFVKKIENASHCLSAPSWVTAVASATNATNIDGGLVCQLLYQSAVDTTSKLVNGAGSIKGWAVTFSGLGTVDSYLQPNSYFNLSATEFKSQNQSMSYIMPEGANITKLSTLVSSTSATATFSIWTGTYGSTANTFTSAVNTQFATIYSILTLSSSISVVAGNAVYVQIIAPFPNTPISDVASITLYFS